MYTYIKHICIFITKHDQCILDIITVKHSHLITVIVEYDHVHHVSTSKGGTLVKIII